MSIYLRPVHKRVPGASCGKSGPISVGLVSRERSTGDARCTISLLVLVFSLPSSNTLENNTVVVTISSLAAIFPILLPAMTPGELLWLTRPSISCFAVIRGTEINKSSRTTQKQVCSSPTHKVPMNILWFFIPWLSAST